MHSDISQVMGRAFLDLPPILSQGYYQVTPQAHEVITFPDSWFVEAAINQLLRTPQLAASLHPHAPSNRRIGRFFENVVYAALRAVWPDRAVQMGVQLQGHSQNQTRGELDFLISSLRHTLHLEVAIKFFLFVPDSGPGLAQFHGPGLNDRLDLKLTKIIHSQLRRKIPNDLLAPAATSPHVSRALWLEGMLFYPWQMYCDQTYPDFSEINLNPTHRKGWWMTHEQSLHLSDSTFVPLDKPFWLFPFEASRLIEMPEALTLNGSKTLDDPLFCLRCVGGVPIDRGFIVPNAWGPNF